MSAKTWPYGVRAIVLLCIFVISWLLWSGLYKTLLLALGAVSCLISLYLAHRMGALHRSVFSWHVLPRLLGYWLWLLKEIIVTSIDVARIVLSPKLPISPTMVEFEAAPQGPIGQVILGNSIILTPGTVTLDIYENKLIVHCLTQEGAEDMLAGDMNRRVAAILKEN